MQLDAFSPDLLGDVDYALSIGRKYHNFRRSWLNWIKLQLSQKRMSHPS